MTYLLNPQVSQDSIVEKLREEYPHVPVIEDGLIDYEYDVIQKFSNGEVKPFIILWFSTARRTNSGRSFYNEKLDGYVAGVDVLVVARNGREARVLLNDIGNTLVGWKPENAGGMVKGVGIWAQSRAFLDSNNRPSRWAATDRFEFGIQTTKVVEAT
jgi:hypothetical protein